MLTGLAILERELGLTEYARHQLERRLRAKRTAAEARRLKAELEELEARRMQTLRLLDDLHEQYGQRHDDD
jgi:hypothetical protein